MSTERQIRAVTIFVACLVMIGTLIIPVRSAEVADARKKEREACRDFHSQKEANAFVKANPKSSYLDRDGDGLACEHLPKE